MRTESDLQHHHPADAPGCHRCGLPLMATATFCPYCERSIHESRMARIVRWRPSSAAAPREPLITETRLLAAGFVLFAIIAAVGLVAAVAI